MAYTHRSPDLTRDTMKVMTSAEVIKMWEAAGGTPARKSEQVRRLFGAIFGIFKRNTLKSLFKLSLILGALELGFAGLLKALGGEGVLHFGVLILFHAIGLYAVLVGAFLLSTIVVYLPVFGVAAILLGQSLFRAFVGLSALAFVALLVASPGVFFIDLPFYDGVLVKLYTLVGILGVALSGLLSVKKVRGFAA